MNTQAEPAVAKDSWTLTHLRQHIQFAVDLELWTIPFYMSAMYSIRDRTSPAFQLIQTVVNQEMLHLQSAANIANAYGMSPEIRAPQYRGKAIPHLEFQLDKPDPRPQYEPYSAEIGPLDTEPLGIVIQGTAIGEGYAPDYYLEVQDQFEDSQISDDAVLRWPFNTNPPPGQTI
jgi:hypothetical protein